MSLCHIRNNDVDDGDEADEVIGRKKSNVLTLHRVQSCVVRIKYYIYKCVLCYEKRVHA